MMNRVLFLLDEDYIDEDVIEKLCLIATAFDEAIFAFKGADEFNKGDFTTGQLLVHLHSLLLVRSKTPFFLIPMALKGEKGISYWIKLKYLLPNFTTLYGKSYQDEKAATQILKCHFRTLPMPEPKRQKAFELLDRQKKRGLFITRAQPFHNGHAAFVKQMAEECEEVIVLIAAAEESHSAKNPLTASERLEMVHQFLQAEVPGRYFLLALPQNSFTLENIYELDFLLPAFQVVYACNPIIKSMCASLNIPIATLKEKISVSGTEIRAHVFANKNIQSFVPPDILNYLTAINFNERLKIIMEEENR